MPYGGYGLGFFFINQANDVSSVGIDEHAVVVDVVHFQRVRPRHANQALVVFYLPAGLVFNSGFPVGFGIVGGT